MNVFTLCVKHHTIITLHLCDTASVRFNGKNMDGKTCTVRAAALNLVLEVLQCTFIHGN